MNDDYGDAVLQVYTMDNDWLRAKEVTHTAAGVWLTGVERYVESSATWSEVYDGESLFVPLHQIMSASKKVD